MVIDLAQSLRLVSYRRISNERPDGTSLMEQARCIGLRIEADGHEWIADFCDIQSGESIDKRDGFQQALQFIDDGHADGLIVFKIDRYARSVADGVRVLKDLHRKEKALICVRDPIDTSSALGEAMFQIALVFAELERRTITERMISGRTARAAQLRYAYGRPPAFHEAVTEDGVKKLVPTPQYYLVKSVIDNLREQGMSWKDIAAELSKREETPPPRRKNGPPRWNPMTVRAIGDQRQKLARWAQSGCSYNYHQPITAADVKEVRALHEKGEPYSKIADLKNVGVSTIERIIKGRFYNVSNQTA